jgi:hypothetical protein
MTGQSSGGLNLPKYQRNEKQQRWVASKRRTARLIQSLWNAAGEKRRNESPFLRLLVQCGWTNAGSSNRGRESTRTWRNRNIADYLKVKYDSDDKLARDLAAHFKALSFSKAYSLVTQHTGITDYYKAFRTDTLQFVKRHPEPIALAFRRVAAKSANTTEKNRQVAITVESLGEIPAAGRHVSPFNGLTPVLSCLDPQCRFPIMNDRTQRLLRCIGREADKEGVVALSKLIGTAYGVKDAFELDAYAFGETFPNPKAQKQKLTSGDSFKDVGFKSEINSMAEIAAKKTIIKKLHNKLINRLNDYILWRQKSLREGKFDALLLGWKKGRDLLIEAKTASEGVVGRAQVRQAIGQLYDYRFTHMPKSKVDLAILLPKQPSPSVQKLLASLGIEVLWFKGKLLTGTIQL